MFNVPNSLSCTTAVLSFVNHNPEALLKGTRTWWIMNSQPHPPLSTYKGRRCSWARAHWLH